MEGFIVNNKLPYPKKYLGQHFLTSSYYAKRIASAIQSSDDSKVVEIGPGKGAVSVFLKNLFPRFHLIEMDKDLIPVLEKKIGPGEWTIHNEDVLKFNFQKLGTPLHLVGNLPYNIAAMIIKKALLLSPAIASITFMVQKEVAERITAPPSTKQNGFLSIFCQFFGTPKILFHLPNGAFFPKPKVTSSVFQMTIDKRINQSIPKEEWNQFFILVSQGFNMRRKTLINSLSWKTKRKKILEEKLSSIDLPVKIRPEELNVSQWLKLYSLIKELD